jgi:predicted RNA binding protein YcfA (HicA-like mRNA interferase family)
VKTPRAISGDELVKALQHFGYRVVRQKGSHMSLTTTQNGEHHLIVPRHGAVRIGTLHRIISEVAEHFEIDIARVRDTLFGEER